MNWPTIISELSTWSLRDDDFEIGDSTTDFEIGDSKASVVITSDIQVAWHPGLLEHTTPHPILF